MTMRFLAGLAATLALAPWGPCAARAGEAPHPTQGDPVLLTLPAALRQAGQASLQADLAALARVKAGQASLEVQASYLPDLKLQGGHLNTDTESALLTAPVQLGPFLVPALTEPIAQRSAWSCQLKADYLVFDFGMRAGALEAARAAEQAVDLGGRDQVRRAQAEVAARYLGALEVRARMRVVAQREQAIQDHLKDARSLLAQGLVARNDLLRAEVALRGVQDAARALADALCSSLEGLNVALGQAPTASLSLPEALGEPPALPWDEATVRQRAAAGNDGVRALEAKARAARAQAKVKARDFLPKVVASLEHDYQENEYLLHPQQNALFIGVSWQLFDGGARSAHLSRARAEQDVAGRELLEASRQAEIAAVQARRAFTQALAELGSARADVAAAQENLRILREQYRMGVAKGADVLDAETLLAEARFSLADRHTRAFTQQAALLALLGEDLAAFYASHLEH